MNTTEWMALLTLATATTFTPGPNTTLSTALAAQGGLRAALPFVLAVPVGWTLLLALCASGVGAAVLAVPWLRSAILWIGVAYLLWLAWQLARTATPTATSGTPLRISFARGVGLQLLNLKAWMLTLTVVGGWIAGQPQPWLRLAWVLPVVVLYAFCSNLAYAWVGAALRHWLAGPWVDGRPSGRRLRRFNAAMAAALAVTALWMALGPVGDVPAGLRR
ncbi:MAG: LysE family translocator [Tepidimonas sp.]|uniref:LysE family translocator n=1 Tax=Tepidimonas sp. TaxID=2002775 RepID=UPI00298EE15F|nr:LysE family translocator [Tepidimonas sp.]MDW8335551.1 LysE family translocator [Tepidimonas sp.]